MSNPRSLRRSHRGAHAKFKPLHYHRQDIRLQGHPARHFLQADRMNLTASSRDCHCSVQHRRCLLFIVSSMSTMYIVNRPYSVTPKLLNPAANRSKCFEPTGWLPKRMNSMPIVFDSTLCSAILSTAHLTASSTRQNVTGSGGASQLPSVNTYTVRLRFFFGVRRSDGQRKALFPNSCSKQDLFSSHNFSRILWRQNLMLHLPLGVLFLSIFMMSSRSLLR